MGRVRPSVCAGVAACCLSVGVLLCREFAGQVWYEVLRRRRARRIPRQSGFDWARLPEEAHSVPQLLPREVSQRGCHAEGKTPAPAPLAIDALMSFWSPNNAATDPVQHRPPDLHGVVTGWTDRVLRGMAGRSKYYPTIRVATEANHAAAAALLGVPYVVGGAHTIRHGPGMHAVCDKIRAVRNVLRNASLVRNGRWLVLLDADAAFLCNSIRPECEGSHSHRNGGLDSAVRQHLPSNRSEAQRPQRTHHSCRQSLLLRSLRSLQARAWRLNHADPSMLILSTFGFFAVRNDAWSRYLFDQFTAALESRPLLCWLSTVPDIAAFFGVARQASASHCEVVYEPELEGQLALHLGSQEAKNNRQYAEDFVRMVNEETNNCSMKSMTKRRRSSRESLPLASHTLHGRS